ncbi:cytochrome P450 [Pseudonocardia xinjiangensis]|uniref:Cytochrome P450 n=1 Tax=Pseudonocardia xinjiangensis TaxID=75289 RepID=A0ABX1RJD4_9PSEU|nr:cytochrome P450 [Pseudonocardia xinjiangensis]
MALLGRVPGLADRLRREPGLIGRLLKESLRLEAPIQCFYRLVTVDSLVGGVEVPAGSRLLVFYGFANRDPQVWPDCPHSCWTGATPPRSSPTCRASSTTARSPCLRGWCSWARRWVHRACLEERVGPGRWSGCSIATLRLPGAGVAMQMGGTVLRWAARGVLEARVRCHPRGREVWARPGSADAPDRCPGAGAVVVALPLDGDTAGAGR